MVKFVKIECLLKGNVSIACEYHQMNAIESDRKLLESDGPVLFHTWQFVFMNGQDLDKFVGMEYISEIFNLVKPSAGQKLDQIIVGQEWGKSVLLQMALPTYTVNPWRYGLISVDME